MADINNFKLQIERRDGVYYVTDCSVVEGLWLWNKDLKKIAENIEPCIELLIERNGIREPNGEG